MPILPPPRKNKAYTYDSNKWLSQPYQLPMPLSSGKKPTTKHTNSSINNNGSIRDISSGIECMVFDCHQQPNDVKMDDDDVMVTGVDAWNSCQLSCQLKQGKIGDPCKHNKHDNVRKGSGSYIKPSHKKTTE